MRISPNAPPTKECSPLEMLRAHRNSPFITDTAYAVLVTNGRNTHGDPVLYDVTYSGGGYHVRIDYLVVADDYQEAVVVLKDYVESFE